jgi:ribosomal protein L14E/L6E/L27E
MAQFMKPGKVALLLAGCYSRCKSIIAKNIDDRLQIAHTAVL